MGETAEQASQTRRSRKLFYLVTISYNKKEYLSRESMDNKYRDIILKTRKYNTEWSSYVSYELNTRHILHLHTIMSSERSPWYKPCKNWNIQFKPFPKKDYPDVVEYINKHDQCREAVNDLLKESQLYNSPRIV